MSNTRKLIRDRRTKEWMTENGFAMTDVAFALDVQSFAQARRISRQHPNRKLELVIHFDDRREVSIPMDDE